MGVFVSNHEMFGEGFQVDEIKRESFSLKIILFRFILSCLSLLCLSCLLARSTEKIILIRYYPWYEIVKLFDNFSALIS